MGERAMASPEVAVKSLLLRNSPNPGNLGGGERFDFTQRLTRVLLHLQTLLHALPTLRVNSMYDAGECNKGK